MLSAWTLQKRNERNTLNIVVEGAVFLSVFSQKAESVVVSKVLELDERVLAVPREHGARSHHQTLSSLLKQPFEGLFWQRFWPRCCGERSVPYLSVMASMNSSMRSS